MMRLYIHDILIPKMLEGISNGTTKAKLLENYALTMLYQETIVEWLMKLGFKYDYAVNKYYVVGHEMKDTIWYKWKFIDIYLLLERCIFRWIQMTPEESENYKGYKRKRSFQDHAFVPRDKNPITTPIMLLIWYSITLTRYQSFNIF